jgi:hypothetical protein
VFPELVVLNKGERAMAARKKLNNKEWTDKYFDIRMAIIEVKPWETDIDAWRRHVKEHPRDLYAKIRVFNREPKAVSIM